MRTGVARWRGLAGAGAGAAILGLVTGCAAKAGGAETYSAAPATPRPSRPAAAPRGPVTVPIKVVVHGKSTAELVPVYIDGKGPYTFLLDTGSTVSSISKGLASKLHLAKSGSTTNVHGVTGSSSVSQARLTHWKLGTAALEPDTVSELNLAKTSGGVAGLLGSDELRHFGSVTIDFARLRLRLARS
jgi:predicted aspartyl protease